MIAIINQLLLAGDKFMPEMQLKQLGPFTKNKERKKCKETGDSRYIYQDKLDKACFQHDMAYADFKDLNRRTAADLVLRVKHLILLKMHNMMDIVDLLQLLKNLWWGS